MTYVNLLAGGSRHGFLQLERGNKSNNRTRGRRQIATRNSSFCIPTIKLILR
jgi:hypothetical protein